VTALQDDDPARAWLLTSSEGRQDGRLRTRERLSQTRPRNNEGGSVGPRIREQEDQAIDPAVASLELEAPRQSLDVRQSRFCLNRDTPAGPADQAIPCTPVARLRHGYFRAPPQARVQRSAEPVQQSNVARVPYRIASRVRPDRELETDCLRQPSQHADACGTNKTTLDPADLGVGDARAPANDTLADPGRDPRFTDLSPGSGDHAPGRAVGTVHPVVATGHGPELSWVSVGCDSPVRCTSSVHCDRSATLRAVRLCAGRSARPESRYRAVVLLAGRTGATRARGIPVVPLAGGTADRAASGWAT
jgi:hypothetical protein